jgi:non-ribosomal peptide synthetase component E (peptide arylation enzyme)
MAGLRDAVTYGEIILTALRRFPDRIAFRQDSRTLTYRQTADLLARWITLFTQRGLKPGEGIGILSPNRPEVWRSSSTRPVPWKRCSRSVPRTSARTSRGSPTA